jgi:hypothetical protein
VTQLSKIKHVKEGENESNQRFHSRSWLWLAGLVIVLVLAAARGTPPSNSITGIVWH